MKMRLLDRILLWVIKTIIYLALGLAGFSMFWWFACFTMWVAQ